MKLDSLIFQVEKNLNFWKCSRKGEKETLTPMLIKSISTKGFLSILILIIASLNSSTCILIKSSLISSSSGLGMSSKTVSKILSYNKQKIKW